jgi:hypothetical protein
MNSAEPATADRDSPPAVPATLGSARAGLELFAFSFVALFLELMAIRWAPAVVRLVAYYANLMLISSFLGLGIGAMLGRQRRQLLLWFPVLLAIDVGFLLFAQYITLPGTTTEHRFYVEASRPISYLSLVGIFVTNAVVFVPLGQRIGGLFEALPVLRAYAWDLGGSLAGTLAFGLFSFTHFSPVLGMSLVMLLVVVFSARKALLWTGPLFGLILCGVWVSNDPAAIWSPYYYITIRETEGGKYVNERSPALREPRPNIRTMVDPPSYNVSVNHDFYQPNKTLDYRRFTVANLPQIREQRLPYDLPYLIAPAHKKVLVLGAGGGTDTEVALLNGAEHVDAVEIDPVLVALSRRFNPSGIYDDPRVTVWVDDARAYIQRATPGYDMVVFGWLDSQALFSSMSNLRLDGYVYTVQSIRTAYRLLNDDGMLSLSFSAGHPWLAAKLIGMVQEATGKPAVIYASQPYFIICAPKSTLRQAPVSYGPFRRLAMESTKVDLATDDWPYLYLSQRTIPTDYLVVIAILAAISLSAVIAIRGRGFTRNDAHFLFLGLGFLLLETKSIGDCSLYFGTTWLVSMIVIAGVLLMVLAANLVGMKLPRFGFWMYAPVLASLLLLYLVPREAILSLPLVPRLLWALVIVPLPIFFAGLIFSTTFRDSRLPSALLGANLVGAMVGGFFEYLGMMTGNGVLTLLVIAAYLASLFCRQSLAKAS